MWHLLVAGLLLGAMSSFHCIGMCGPLALSLPVQHLPKPMQWMGMLMYNIGRVITYGLLGLLVGLLGRRIYVSGWQQWFSIGVGTILLLLTIMHIYFKAGQRSIVALRFQQVISSLMMRIMNIRGMTGYLLLGMANGLLPCGMVYVAVLSSITVGTITGSVFFMIAFGLGTLPLMIAFSIMGMRLSLLIRQRIKRIVPYLVGSMALLLILRGMNLGIPFISPFIPDVGVQAINCH